MCGIYVCVCVRYISHTCIIVAYIYPCIYVACTHICDIYIHICDIHTHTHHTVWLVES